MKTKQEVMTNAVLKYYNEIKQLIRIFNTKINFRAVNSYCSEVYRSCEDVADKICELLESKRILQNIISLVDSAVSKMPILYQQIFGLRFCNKLKILEISEVTNVSKQTVFRVVHSIERNICHILSHEEIFNNFCNFDYQKISFFADVYSCCEAKVKNVA